VAFLLSSLGFAVSRGFHRMLEPLELEPGEFALLRAVDASGGESQNVLAERLHISPSWMVAIVDELERRGLLERRPHARDRRVRNLDLTPAGKKLLKQAERKAQQFDRQVTDPLTETEVQELLELLQRVAAGLDLQPGAAHAALRERG
jgi:DNA-binding MarR family transcriptional regulator